ncbi:MAG: Xaa-Pro dipeptidase [Bacilli bacterium]|nr:Xaa-Pro dipeptidase [Bacilli bacterium]
MKSRVEQLRETMRQGQIEALLITGPENRRYMTGFSGTSGYVLITGQDALLLTDSRYVIQASKEAPDFEVIQHGVNFALTLANEIQRREIRQIGFEKEVVTFALYEQLSSQLQGIELVPVGALVDRLRQVKDDGELSLIREAARIADAAFDYILGFMRPGLRETEVALELEFFMRKNGASSTSFDTIIASGHRSSLPHGVASDKVLMKGDFVTLDFGAYYRGYCSDITRTVVLGPGPSVQQNKIYSIVLEAQLRALENLRAGLTGKQADALARDVIKSAGYDGQFGHSLGHGIGLAIHEGPRLSAASEDLLVPGMVVTVEPGIYVADFGGVRIEDDVLITGDGIEILTHSPKELIVL